MLNGAFSCFLNAVNPLQKLKRLGKAITTLIETGQFYSSELNMLLAPLQSAVYQIVFTKKRKN